MLNVNPTRMELMRLKARYASSVRGHKLLKDRADEMVRRFVALVGQNKELREQTEQELIECMRTFCTASAKLTQKELSGALSAQAKAILSTQTDSLMGIEVPRLSLAFEERQPPSLALLLAPHGIMTAIEQCERVLSDLITLAQLEKTCNILADEIQKIRRRVNALEQFTIPTIKAEMKRIRMKLDENERSNQVRLMKVKAQISDDNNK